MKRIRLLSMCLIGACLLAQTACRGKVIQRRFLIPNGYVGWVKINYEVKDAPALPVEDGFYLLKFPPSGHLQTSTPNEFGEIQDEYFYYSGGDREPFRSTTWGGGGMIWAGYTGQGNGETYEGWFIGTEQQYRSVGGSKP